MKSRKFYGLVSCLAVALVAFAAASEAGWVCGPNGCQYVPEASYGYAQPAYSYAAPVYSYAAPAYYGGFAAAASSCNGGGGYSYAVPYAAGGYSSCNGGGGGYSAAPVYSSCNGGGGDGGYSYVPVYSAPVYSYRPSFGLGFNLGWR